MLVGPLGHASYGVAGVGSLDGKFERDLDGEEPTAVHAALGAHVDPGAYLEGIDQRAHVVKTVDLALWCPYVPEEVHHPLNEDVLRTAGPPGELLRRVRTDINKILRIPACLPKLTQ